MLNVSQRYDSMYKNIHYSNLHNRNSYIFLSFSLIPTVRYEEEIF